MNNEKIHSVRFNEDNSSFICATSLGVRIFSVEPLRELKKILSIGSVSQAVMLQKSNLFCFVPGGSGKAEYSTKVVLLYDMSINGIVMDATFQTDVLNIRLRRDKLVVVIARQIHVFSFPGVPSRIIEFDTKLNIRGLCEISPRMTSKNQILVYPGHATGSIIIVDLDSGENQSRSARTINCHDGEIRTIAINQEGTKVATASDKGTIIRVYCTMKFKQLHEFRRGATYAQMYCINFSFDDTRLCCFSDKGTSHIFKLDEKSSSYYPTVFPTSFGKIPLGDSSAGQCVFGRSRCDGKHTIYIVNNDGNYWKHSVDASGSYQRSAVDSLSGVSRREEFEK